MEAVEQKPYVTIDGVDIQVEDLPEEGQGVFGRLQRLNQKKVNQTLDLEETQAAINFFSDRIVQIINEDKSGTTAVESETKTISDVEVTEESDS